jgi:hypothetical protein
VDLVASLEQQVFSLVGNVEFDRRWPRKSRFGRMAISTKARIAAASPVAATLRQLSFADGATEVVRSPPIWTLTGWCPNADRRFR